MTKGKKKKKNNTVSKIVSIVLICVALVFFVGVFKRVYDMFALQKKAEIIAEQLEAIKDENASLVSTKEKLEDPDYAITYARGEYMFSKGDEKVFYLPAE